MRAGRAAQVGDHVHRAADGGGEADAVVGAEDVVVHRLRDPDDRDSLLGQALGEGERVVAADRDQRLEMQPLDRADRLRRQVHEPRLVRRRRRGEQVRGDLARRHGGGVGARGVEDRPAGAVDRARAALGQPHRPLRLRLGAVRPGVQQRRPAAPQPPHFPARVLEDPGQRLDRHVEAGDVAAAGEHAHLPRHRCTENGAAPRRSRPAGKVGPKGPRHSARRSARSTTRLE